MLKPQYIIIYLLTLKTLFCYHTIHETTHNISVNIYNSVILTNPDNENFYWYEWTTNATTWNCDSNLHICYTANTTDTLYFIDQCTSIYLHINCTKTQLHINNVTTKTPVQYTLNKANLDSEIVRRHNFSIYLIYPTQPPPTPNTTNITDIVHVEAGRSTAAATITPITVLTGGAFFAGFGYAYVNGWYPQFLGTLPKLPIVTNL
ncbi:membrane protein RL11F [Cercopithecine betaherpesvirus 5]|uniref:Membrane protein RL11F n=1 Tax=Simian cytomegalovirus (strain Colburn) TaxID=50292 RepID=G8XT73_SCMVC|nr:membrane protein RL11F [Cercopithecine betaherpesvirus 5]AEV80366.1 membrane protein RL11F [Cercopithecine betaherpesvirus 5]